MGTSHGKKCESEYTSQKKVRNIPSKYEQTGRAHATFDKLSLQVLKKGAGARYIRQFSSSREEKRGGRTIHSTCFVFEGTKKRWVHDTFDKLCLQVPQGGPVMGGTPRRAHKARFLPFKRAFFSLPGWTVKTPVRNLFVFVFFQSVQMRSSQTRR